MNNYLQVDALTQKLCEEGKSKSLIAWETAKACIGWPYVYGAWGEFCTPANRRKRYSADHPTIKSKCQNFDGNKTCDGCQWYPDEERVRCFDCRGFTDWTLRQVGIDLVGEGATSQWNTDSNWEIKGTIDGMPVDTLVCLFVANGKKMDHTGFGYNDQTVECSSGVQYSQKRNKKWTHYAVPKGITGGIPLDESKPILKKGDKGAYVVDLQTELINRGYDLGKWGADGSFGKQTEKAVKAFQQDHGLSVDGIVGPATWDALSDTPVARYTVHVPGLTEAQAGRLLAEYPNAWASKDEGE